MGPLAFWHDGLRRLIMGVRITAFDVLSQFRLIPLFSSPPAQTPVMKVRDDGSLRPSVASTTPNLYETD